MKSGHVINGLTGILIGLKRTQYEDKLKSLCCEMAIVDVDKVWQSLAKINREKKIIVFNLEKLMFPELI